MAQTALFMAPMARKKRVEAKYDPNSYRVISQQAESAPFARQLNTFTSTSDFNILGQPGQPPRSPADHRHNRPNPNAVGFLRQDVRLLNEPVCNVYTACTRAEQHKWWPSSVSEEPLQTPAHTLDTTVRQDFQYRGAEVRASARHTANPNKQPIQGAAPVTSLRAPDGSQRVWKEGISYEHQYNSRADPSYPIRAKRHGSFVWDQVDKQEVSRMLHAYGIHPQQSANQNPITHLGQNEASKMAGTTATNTATQTALPTVST